MGDVVTDRHPPEARPVAAVVVDTSLAHLDRTFEYSVPPQMAETAVPGARVRVRFAGRDLDGFVVERRTRSEHEGRLAPLRRVVSPEPVLTAEVLALARAVADRYAGALGDVLRLAVPRRHAAAEKALALRAPGEPAPLGTPDPAPWTAYPAGVAMLRRISAGEAPAASWLALPGRPPELDWPRALAVAAGSALVAGRGALVVVPDHRDVDRVDAELSAVLGRGRHVRLTSGQAPQARYTAWLRVLRGQVRCVVGTRAAMFAPVHDLGLVAWWDDGDDLLSEPRAPYPHVREVLALRARLAHAALLSAGFGRSVEMQQAVAQGVLASVTAAAGTVRQAAPRALVAGEGTDPERDGPAARAHLPSLAWRSAKAALESGPVLVQVPRRGYLPSLSCQDCRAPARCPRCHGPLGLAGGGAAPSCRWCGSPLGPAGFDCPHCGGVRIRSGAVGARRTAEELGRAFPGVPVHTSSSGEVLARVAAAPSLVIATPGAEPVADDGYAAVLLLDAWALLDRPFLDASVEALRRWLGAAALARGAARGGVVVLAGVPLHTTLPPVEALVRWDPAWLAERELAERAGLGLPPAVRMAEVIGPRAAVQRALAHTELGPAVDRLGPLPHRPARHERGQPTDSPADSPAAGWTGGVPDGPAAARADNAVPGRDALVQVLLRAPLDEGPRLAAALAAMRAWRSASKEKESVTVRVDPTTGIG